MSFRYNQDEANRRSKESAISFEGEESMTEQSHKDACDINVIMARYEKTGVAPGTFFSPNYGDFTGIDDFHSASNAVIAAQDAFMGLDAHLRKRFNNDPGEFLAFMDDPKNLDEIVSLGS